MLDATKVCRACWASPSVPQCLNPTHSDCVFRRGADSVNRRAARDQTLIDAIERSAPE